MLNDLNDLIEDKTGTFINKSVYRYSKDDPRWLITSVESYKYGLDNKSTVRSYEENLPRMTSKLLKEDTDPLIDDVMGIIHSSPVLNQSIVLYRGMNETLNLKSGDIYNHKSLIWGSLHRDYAEHFMYNTAECYKNGNTGFRGAFGKKSDGSLLCIEVPVGLHYYERPINPDFNPSNPKSEVILEPNVLYVRKSLGNIYYCQIKSSKI